MTEEFKEFKKSERVTYLISNWGRVITVNKKSGHVRTLKTTTRITCKTDRQGYKTFGTNCRGVSKSYYVHREVCKLFMEAPEEGMTSVNHIDGDKHNNFIQNLEWSNHKENALHAYRLGLIKKSYLFGNKNSNYGNTKYPRHLIHAAYSLFDLGYKGREITKMLGIDTKNLSHYKINRKKYES